MKPQVPIGPATLVGYALTALGTIGTVVSTAGTNLHLPTETVAILTVAIGFATNFLRSWQAKEQIKAAK